MNIRDPRDSEPASEQPSKPALSEPEPRERPDDKDDLDLDLEEIGDGDRLKEGFTGQER